MVAIDNNLPFRARDTGRGIVVHDGKVLLMERWRPGLHYFSIPGGGIEKGETPEHTTVRELLEETSIKVEIDRLVLVMETDIRHYIYLCKYISGVPELAPDSPEAIYANEDNNWKPGWVPITDVSDILFTYWKPISEELINGLMNGFADEPVTITVKD